MRVTTYHSTHLSKDDSPYREAGHAPAAPRHHGQPARSQGHGPSARPHGHAQSARPHGRGRPARKEKRGIPAKRHQHVHKPSSKKRHKPKPHARPSLTSHPTTRNAFVATREWLLEQHGPVCAYCGTRHRETTMTLDHVAPRRGQTAYDRRDNLVLACKSCNQKKRDLAPLAFLLGARSRAVNLLKYGAHLSQGLLDLARSLVPEHARDDDSPYRD